MKILRNILCAVMAVAVLASCSSLSKLAGNMDYQNGSTTGSVLVNLLSQFKNSGTVNLTSGQNLLNIASLATALTSLKNNTGTAANTASTAVKNFTQGLLATSQNTVNSNNVQSVISGLTTLANTDLTGVQQSLQQGQTNANTSSFSSSLLGLLGGLLNK